TSRLDVGGELTALLIAEQSDVRQDQSRVLRQLGWRKLLFLDEVEQEPALQQRVVHAVDVLLQRRSPRRGVKEMRPLAHENGDAGDGLLVDEMRLGPGHPIEKDPRRFSEA